MGVIAAPGPSRASLRGILHRTASDERLLDRLRAGDDRAFEVIYDRHHRGLLSFCRHMLGDPGGAEDALQHSFVSAYSALRAPGREIHVRPFLYAIARNRCLSMLRARREEVALEDSFSVPTDGLPAQVERRADLQEMLADMQRLPADQREALVLCEMADLSHDEVAEVLGVRKEKVRALVFQARENLMQWREARHTDCREIREQLATLTGGSLRRTNLRRHVAECDGCRAFRDEVKRQRTAMAGVMPVAPSLALKGTIMAAALGSGGAIAVTGGTLIGVGATGAGGGLMTKTLLGIVLAGGAGAGSYAAVEGYETPPPPAREPISAKPAHMPRAVAPALAAPARPLPKPVHAATPQLVQQRAAIRRKERAQRRAAARREAQRRAAARRRAAAPVAFAAPAYTAPAYQGAAQQRAAAQSRGAQQRQAAAGRKQDAYNRKAQQKQAAYDRGAQQKQAAYDRAAQQKADAQARKQAARGGAG